MPKHFACFQIEKKKEKRAGWGGGDMNYIFFFFFSFFLMHALIFCTFQNLSPINSPCLLFTDQHQASCGPSPKPEDKGRSSANKK